MNFADNLLAVNILSEDEWKCLIFKKIIVVLISLLIFEHGTMNCLIACVGEFTRLLT